MKIIEYIKTLFTKIQVEKKAYDKFYDVNKFADNLYYKLRYSKKNLSKSFFAYAGGAVYIYFSYVEEEEDGAELCSLFYLYETGEYITPYEMTDSMIDEFKDVVNWQVVDKEPVKKTSKMPWQFTTNKGNKK